MHTPRHQPAATLPPDPITGVGSYEWHVPDNRLVWSPGLLHLFGVRRAPSDEAGFLALIHPDDRLRVEAEISTFLERGDSYDHEFSILRPDGEVRIIHDRGEILRAEDGTALVLRGLNVDVTRQRNAQDAAGQERLRRLEQAVGVGFYDFDVANRRSWWSSETFRLLDVDPHPDVDPVAISMSRVVDEDRARLLALQKTTDRRIGPFDIEYRFRHRDGSIRWIRDRGETLGPLDPVTGLAWKVRGTVTDITDQKRHDPVAAAGTETFRQVIERSPFGIVVVDSAFRLVALSGGAQQALGHISPLLGRDYEEILRLYWDEPFASAVVAAFRHTLATGETYHASDSEHRRDDAGEAAFDWTLEQIVLPDGQPGVACYFHDMTELNARVRALRESEQRLQLAHEAAGMGAWDLDLATGDAYWTPHLYRLLDLPEAAPASADLLFDQVHPEDRAALRAAFDRAVSTGSVFEEEFRVRRADGTVRHLVGRGRTFAGPTGRPERMFGVNYDVTRRRRMERAVRESARQLRQVLDNAIAFIGVLDLDGTLREANASALAAGGLARDEVIGRRFWETYWWSHDPEVADRLRQAVESAAAGQAVRYDAVVRMRGDTRMTIDVQLSPLMDEDGRVRQIVASGFDVTDREEALAHSRFLMREISHRAKNTIALTQAIGRQIWRIAPDDFFRRFDSRLQSLAACHDLLVNDAWARVRLEDLARRQLDHFADLVGTRIHLDGPSLEVSAQVAQALGMAFHELATNAGKYGALSNDTGEVDLRWSLAPGPDGQRIFTASWHERGGPEVTPPEHTGFGSVVIDTLLRGTLSGEVEIAYSPDGLRWQVTCPESALRG